MIISYTSQDQIMHVTNEVERKYTPCHAKATHAVLHHNKDLTDHLLQSGLINLFRLRLTFKNSPSLVSDMLQVSSHDHFVAYPTATSADTMNLPDFD